MYFAFVLYFTLVNTAYCAQNVFLHNDTQKMFIYNNTYKYNALIDVSISDVATQVLDFTEESELYSGFPTRVHVSTNDSFNLDYPLFVTAAQQKGVSSWELPLVVDTSRATLQFNDMARTLCPHDSGPNITRQSRPTLTLATSSPRNVSVRIQLERVKDFYIEVNKGVALTATPSSPRYYYFSFDRDPLNATLLPKFNYTIPKNVLLVIESDDDVCAVVSIQNNSCPVFDNEKDIQYQGYHFTMTTKGGITVTQSMFPNGFYVVFMVKESDEECSGLRGAGPRRKHFRLQVVGAVSYAEYLPGALAALALMLLVALLGPLAAALSCNTTEEVIIIEEAPGPSSSRAALDVDAAPILNQNNRDSEEESEVDEPDEPVLSPAPLTVAGLSRARPRAHARRSNRYFWSALTVALVYALPVVQLLYTYQQMVFQTGDQDLCYYNYLCALPLGQLADFNHVFSNVGYVLLGLTFMLLVRSRPRTDETQELGIPQHRGLFYSMGLALVMEGVLSACYHLCPNKMNFQFDSSFMYVTAVLVMVKLYQSRHADVNASAHATFMLIAFLMAIGFYGIMNPSVYFWVLFTVLHLGACVLFTLKIYYVGRFKIERRVFARAAAAVRGRGLRALWPDYGARAALLAAAAVANVGLAAAGLYEHNKDFARHLLAILMGNAILYTLGYVVLKLRHRERLPLGAWVWLALAHAAWALAAVLFLDSRTKWSQTPAQSRQHNAPCSALRVFDSHDEWHLASAAAMFFSFNALLLMDEPLAATPRHLIPVF